MSIPKAIPTKGDILAKLERRLDRETDWLNRNIVAIRSQFQGEFIAVKDEKVVAHDRSPIELLRAMRRAGVDLSDALVQRITPI